jgi:hypothetical protein
MVKTKKESLQSIKVAASQTLKTRVVKSQKQYVRNVKHKATRYSDEHRSLFCWEMFNGCLLQSFE